MFNTIYRLRLFVEETSQYYPILLCGLKDKDPTFADLINNIQRTINMKLNLDTCRFTTVDTNITLCDDRSLRNALKYSVPNRQRLEIALYQKSRENATNQSSPSVCLLDEMNSERTSTNSITTISAQQHSQLDIKNVPVIKPTAHKWSSSILSINTIINNNDTFQSNQRRCTNDSNTPSCYHKDSIHFERHDSAISLDGPLRKKQKVMSVCHSRKLPEPSTPASQPLFSLRENSVPLEHNNSLHPLEPNSRCFSIATSSNTLPYISSSSFFHQPPTLPAISSITVQCPNDINNTGSFLLNSQLAPIIHKNNEELYKSNKRSRASVASTNHAHNLQQTTVYVCEHISDSGKACGQTFRRSYDLSRHQTIHLKNRPYCYCDKCGKRFTRMDALRRHERVQGHHSSAQQKQHRSLSTSALPPQKSARV
ncbi:MAG: hypothetical protein EXX96DRAFT_565514 [Benjaminiella poitrasii]|nr:MAG: hypothetical protein EXX96DRAFT_565514 [Benjaminiella poitrasii]